MGTEAERPVAVYAALAANAMIATTKFIAGTMSGSAAMVSEGIHSLIDSGNELLLLYGLACARRPPDEKHPYGHGKELYFWSFVVAVLLFGVGGGLSVYEGIQHLFRPAEVKSLGLNVIVLGISFVFEAGSLALGLRQLKSKNARGRSLFAALRASKDPSVFTIIVEDLAALCGLLIALVGVFVSHLARTPIPDAIASIAIGLVLATVAIFLARECRGLLLGESASRAVRRSLRGIVESDHAVMAVKPPLTMHLGPDEVLVNLVIQFRDGLDTHTIATAITRIERCIRRAHPEVRHVFVEAAALHVIDDANPKAQSLVHTTHIGG